MEWVERLNSTINYIEENLTGEISLDEIGRIACCSSYHYQRMFAYIADMPLSEYIRRRKMCRAAADLLDSDSKVIDAALRYGYDSPTAFNRAFKSVHGIAPSEVKKCGGSLKAYPPISFKLTVKGDYSMDYRIEKRESFRIVGVTAPLAHNMEDNARTLPQFWQKVAADGTMNRLCTLMDGPVMGMLGVSDCNNTQQWKYYIAVASSKPAEGLEELLIPAATWAIFPAKGQNTKISELEKRIVAEWLPTSGYEYANAPDIEVYIDPNPDDGRYEIWIPVTRKQETV